MSIFKKKTLELLTPIVTEIIKAELDKPTIPDDHSDSVEDSAPEPVEPATSVYDNLPSDFDGVTWLHTDVSGWPVTTTLNVTLDSKYIHLAYNGASWKPVSNVSGNLWLIIDYKGKRYAATCEWTRHNQSVKEKKCVNGDHIKRDPLKTWKPTKGETIGFMVSGLCRDAKRNVQERSDVAWVVWK
jgi:hypothetical protein